MPSAQGLESHTTLKRKRNCDLRRFTKRLSRHRNLLKILEVSYRATAERFQLQRAQNGNLYNHQSFLRLDITSGVLAAHNLIRDSDCLQRINLLHNVTHRSENPPHRSSEIWIDQISQQKGGH